MTTIEAVLVARAVPFGPKGEPSAIAKKPAASAVRVTMDGLAGDEHGDLVHHGGRDKAVHHYPREHYAAWIAELRPTPDALSGPGAFGENVSTFGATEHDVCVGDVYRLGTSLVQVSRGRQPCWRLNHRFGVPDMVRRVFATGRAGWYYRVLDEGDLAAGDSWTLVHRPQPGWTLARVFEALYSDRADRAELGAIAQLPAIAEGWRQKALDRLLAAPGTTS